METKKSAEIITKVEQYEITVTRWSEHNNCDYKSEPAELIKRNIEHVFKWKMLCPETQRKNLEAIFIALYKPSLNDQKSFDRLML